MPTSTALSLSFTCLIALLLPPANAEDITLGYFTMGPHIVYDAATQNAKGPLPELLQEHLAPAMGVNIKLVEMPLIRVLTEMSKGNIAGAAMFGYTDDRALKHIYPKQHFSEMRSVLVVHKNHKLEKIVTASELLPIKVSYVRGAILTPFVRDPRLSWEMITGNNVWQRNVQKVITGRAEAAYSPQQANMIYAINLLNVADQIKLLRLPEPPQNIYTIFSSHRKHRNLSERYDKAMNAIDGRAVYNKLVKRYTECTPTSSDCHQSDSND